MSRRAVVAVAPHRYQDTCYLPGQRYERPADDPGRAAEVFEPGAVAVDWWGAPGRVLAAEPAPFAQPFSGTPQAGNRRIVQGCGYDPGSAAYRFHSAINECTPHASAFVRFGDSNPHSSLRQYDGERDLAQVRQLCWEADVLHCHMDYTLLGGCELRDPTRVVMVGHQPRADQLVIRHYHGSRADGTSNVEQTLDDQTGAIQVGARLSLLAESPRMQWLPIAVPVQRYLAMSRAAGPRRAGAFRVAHSPTQRAFKGTEVFLAICAQLRQRGLDIEPVLIEGVSHAEALGRKASCDAVFDSFWLGLQGSGIEGGAMGLPVVAGDPDVRALYEKQLGEVPYSYANDAAALAEILVELATDPAFLVAESVRLHRYVREYHDYPAVARRYEALLATAIEPAGCR